ncbi:uncharacterized protein LOC134229549 [Saccostrea cucullata]|uniref:uncharacterized protein LOC134229549 n=1 Tax=Saccostrea cuccullata TaxID=36930 RepID=UPI002ED01082
MLQSLALALGLLNLLHVKSLSVLTDSVQNVTQLDTTDIDSKNLDVVRQLLNQETIIRIALMKNVHSLMKDMVDLKQSMEKLETSQQRTEIKLTTLQQEVNELKRENENLRLENRRHEETIGETKENFTEMHEHILQFAGTIEGKREAFEKNTTTILGDLKVEVRYLSITLLDLNKHTLEKDKSIPALIEEKYDILSTKLNASLESLNNDLLASSARISKSVLDLENRQKSFVSSMFDDINKTIGDIRNDVKQSQYDHMKLSSAVSSLEVFRINVTRNKCVSHEIGCHWTFVRINDFYS